MAASKNLVLTNEENELKCWLNTNDFLYIEVGEVNAEVPYSKGHVTLDKDDVIELIKELKSLVKQM